MSTKEERDDMSETTAMEPPSRLPDESLSDYINRLDKWRDERIHSLKDLPKLIDESELDHLRRSHRIEAHYFNAVAAKKEEEYSALLAQKDERKSVMKLLRTFNGLPGIMRHKWTAPFIADEFKAGSSDEDSNAPATICELSPCPISSFFKEFHVNLKEMADGEACWVKSSLCIRSNCDDASTSLVNLNVASLSLHVHDCLTDAVRCLGLKDAIVYREISFFSMRPNIVALKYKDMTVLAIKVLKRLGDSQKVMESETAAGQCLDFAYELKQLGIAAPIVCLSTYSHMRIGSTESSIEAIAKASVKRLGKVNERCSFDDAGSHETKNQVSCDSATPMVEESRNLSKGPAKRAHDGTSKEPTEATFDAPDRSIYFSETFELENMFQALYFAVACACVSAEISQKAIGEVSTMQNSRIPEEGQILKNQWFILAQEASYRWTKVTNVRATFALKTHWPRDTAVFMNCILGKGRFSKVYLCTDSSGRHFALKMMFCSPERGNGDRVEQSRAIRKHLETEANRWKHIYPEFQSSIWEGTLNGVTCLAMPYFAPVPWTIQSKKTTGEKLWAEIRRIRSLGYVYEEPDIRWHHVGIRRDENDNERLFFLDMASLDG